MAVALHGLAWRNMAQRVCMLVQVMGIKNSATPTRQSATTSSGRQQQCSKSYKYTYICLHAYVCQQSVGKSICDSCSRKAQKYTNTQAYADVGKCTRCAAMARAHSNNKNYMKYISQQRLRVRWIGSLCGGVAACSFATFVCVLIFLEFFLAPEQTINLIEYEKRQF